MGLALALVVVLITFLSGYFFLAKTWWFPVDITANYGHAIDHQFMLTLAITGAIFVVAQLALAYAVWRYRDRRDGRKAGYSHGNNKLELTWTTAAAIIFIGLNLMGYHIWAFVHFMGPQPGSMRVEVWGEQFAWYFRYRGPDGKFGPVHVDKVDDATGNFLGLDRDRDPDSKGDIVTATLAIPVNQPVEVILRSKDVTHSFFVRELRLKQDLVPGVGMPLGRKSPYREPAARLGNSSHLRSRLGRPAKLAFRLTYCWAARVCVKAGCGKSARPV